LSGASCAEHVFRPKTSRAIGVLPAELEAKGNETMAMATIVVGNVTPLVRKEIEERGGGVRQMGDSPLLFLVQIPHSQWVSSHPTDRNHAVPQDTGSAREDIGIGSDDLLGEYLLRHSDGWMCEYHHHPYDLTQTELRSFEDPPLEHGRTEREERENLRRIACETMKAIGEACTYHTSLTFTAVVCHEWADLHGRAFYCAEELLPHVLLRAHRFVRTRLPHYRMTISFLPLAVTPGDE